MYWIQYIENGPRRVNHAAGILDNLIFSFGGYSNTEDYTRVTPIDIQIFNIDTLKWHFLPKPQPTEAHYSSTPSSRYGHTIVVYKRKFYLWGGRNDHPRTCKRLFCYDPRIRQWSVVPIVGEIIPNARDGHSACVINNRMYIFGGFEDEGQQFSNDLYYFDFDQSSWYLYIPHIGEEIPQCRDFHTATNLDNRMYVFGGRFDQIGPEQIQENIYDNRLHVFDPQENFWSLISVKGDIPCGRRSHSAFAYNGKLYIFGGYNNVLESHFNDIHQFDPLTSTWRRIRPHGISNPIPRRRQCCVVIGHRMYMFGGTSPVLNASFPEHLYQYQTVVGTPTRLNDQNDLFIFDFAPTLRTLCLIYLAQQKIDKEYLPQRFHQEYLFFLQSNLSRPRLIDTSRRA